MVYALHQWVNVFTNPRQYKLEITIFREDAISAKSGFHTGPLSRSNWNLEMLVFVEGGKNTRPMREPTTTQPTYGTGPESNPDHIGERRALSRLRHPCFPLIILLLSLPHLHFTHPVG